MIAITDKPSNPLFNLGPAAVHEFTYNALKEVKPEKKNNITENTTALPKDLTTLILRYLDYNPSPSLKVLEWQNLETTDYFLKEAEKLHNLYSTNQSNQHPEMKSIFSALKKDPNAFLIESIKNKNMTHIYLALLNRANVNYREESKSALHAALDSKEILLVKLLLSLEHTPINMNYEDKRSYDYLRIALDNGFPEAIPLLMQRPDCDVNLRVPVNQVFSFLLENAVSEENLEAVCMILLSRRLSTEHINAGLRAAQATNNSKLIGLIST